jgi:hypothetical protein
MSEMAEDLMAAAEKGRYTPKDLSYTYHALFMALGKGLSPRLYATYVVYTYVRELCCIVPLYGHTAISLTPPPLY